MVTRGERLRAFLIKTTGGRRGWQVDLVARSGVKRQTVSKWTHPAYDGYPDLESLSAVAEALGVRPWELVAALDGDAPELEEDRVRRIVREEVARLAPPR